MSTGKQMFTSIVVSGGAVKVLSTIGCIQYLEENNMISNIMNFVGTSAGSILCFFLILQYKAAEIAQFLNENLNDETINTFDMDNVFNVFTNFGISDGSNLVILLERILYKKLKLKDISFLELTKLLGKNLVVCVSNLTKECKEFFCVDSQPNMSVINAIRASCAIPFLFNPVTIDNQLYVDGAIYNNFPVDYFKENRLKDILCINIIQKNCKVNTDIVSYFMYIIYSLINKVNNKNYEDNDKNVVTIDLEDSKWFSFSNMKIQVSKEEIDTYINSGYNIIKSKLG